MHVSRDELEPTVIGEYEGRSTDSGAFLRPGHFVQTLEPVELLEISPVAEHDRTMATVVRNMGLVAS